MTYNPSEQQANYIDWCRDRNGNAILQAVAGAGKTTTILQACKRGINGSVTIAAFNKRIADEIKTKISELGLSGQVQADTFHALGFRSWRRAAPKVKVEGKKMFLLADNLVPQPLRAFTVRLVSLAKQNGIGLRQYHNDAQEWMDIVDHHSMTDLLASERGAEVDQQMVEDGIGHAIRLLKESNKQCEQVIDFDDMLYAPLFFKSSVWKSEWVKVDEAQDSNIVRRMFVKEMLQRNGRAVFVGDERQAINGFAGADNDAMNSLRQEFNCTELPLTITYRCPKLIVAEAREIVDHIEAHEDAPDGIVEDMDYEDFLKLPFDDPSEVVLCRNNAPLIAVAYNLIRRRIGCRVEGKDIGAGLLALCNKWKVRSLDALSDQLEKYREAQVKKMIDKGNEVAAGNLEDRIDSLETIIDSLPAGSTMLTLTSTIIGMFGDSNDNERQKLFTLSSIHKSKGREWPTVYLLGPQQFMPSLYARQEWQKLQEENLFYVAVTRSFRRLVYVNNVPQKKRVQK
jgi:DNA helicase II / ATP-dependent DNA helicase PcrA